MLNTVSLSTLTGINAGQLQRLAKLGLHSVQDLLLHLPLRYEDRTKIYAISDLVVGQHAQVKGEILNTMISSGGRRSLISQISDGSGILNLRFFHFNQGMINSLKVGTQVCVYGEIKRGLKGAEMIHPEFQSKTMTSGSLTPVYSTTEGLRQSTLRRLTEQALNVLNNTAINELLPDDLRKDLPDLTASLHLLHRPPAQIALSDLSEGKHPAQRRLILEELLAYHLSMLVLRAGVQRHYAVPIPPNQCLTARFINALPFTPTQAQTRVVKEIEEDLTKPFPMMRLVQGDVGSGKTLVAACVALTVIAQGKQVAIMAPTELLAEQHAENFRRWFTPLNINVGWLAGAQKGKARQSQLNAIAQGEVSFIVGTHALFQENVIFHDLTLVIIDEQHRFGVHQRLLLWEKGKNQQDYPHQLIMTATPIPRTLAMTLYADLDVSVIDELPPGRSPITTVALPDTRRDEIIARVKQVCTQENRQAYWVCTLIEESTVLQAQAAQATYEMLKESLPELTIALVHGRMKAKEKQLLMQGFREGEVQLLVATTVIEVGVDVPNASLMIIENPERLGLAQLHQLRGRVGRGQAASFCVLLYKTPLARTAQKRLDVLRHSQDGFIIAERDLEIRGPGELLGVKQTGNITFKIADLMRDQTLIPQVQHWARIMHQHFPTHAQALMARWLPTSERYTQV